MKIDKKIIKELSDYLEEFNLTELEYTEKDTKIKVSKNNVTINSQGTSSNAPTSSKNEVKKITPTNSGIEVKSPIIGIPEILLPKAIGNLILLFLNSVLLIISLR